jgi:metal-sulfur cluster biosynthetic enzyme
MPTDSEIREALRTVIDPELGVNIVDLGLVYRIDIDNESRAHITMTMTTPACPLGDYLKDLAASAIRERVSSVDHVDITFEWDPPWSPDMMSAEARRQLGDP